MRKYKGERVVGHCDPLGGNMAAATRQKETSFSNMVLVGISSPSGKIRSNVLIISCTGHQSTCIGLPDVTIDACYLSQANCFHLVSGFNPLFSF